MLHVWFQGEDYEVRTYPAARWVSTTTAGVQWDPAISTGFRKLFKYIQGANLNSESGLRDTAERRGKFMNVFCTCSIYRRTGVNVVQWVIYCLHQWIEICYQQQQLCRSPFFCVGKSSIVTKI